MSKGAAALDWSKTGTLEAMATWLLNKSGAVLVLAIRAEDAVVVVPKGVRMADAEGVIYQGLADALERQGKTAEAAKDKETLRTIRKGVNG